MGVAETVTFEIRKNSMPSAAMSDRPVTVVRLRRREATVRRRRRKIRDDPCRYEAKMTNRRI